MSGQSQAAIQTKRGWLKYRLGEGARSARQGWEAGGRQEWLVIPADSARKWAFDSKGRIKSNAVPQLLGRFAGARAYC